jgi:AcrR family transcriptional regulator
VSHKEALLEGARRCLEEKGYARTTARDIVAASDTNLGSIGYHFGSKDALLNEALLEGFTEWTQRLGELTLATPEASPLERLAGTWMRMLDEFPKMRWLLVGVFESIAQAQHSPELRRQLADHYESSRALVAETIRAVLGDDAEAAGGIPEVFAAFMVAVCDGLAVQWLLDSEHAPTGAELGAALAAAADYLASSLSS